MGSEVIQVKADEDDCIYMYSVETDRWSKVCDIPQMKDLPPSVREKIAKMQRSTII
jgi:hypothetical protein